MSMTEDEIRCADLDELLDEWEQQKKIYHYRPSNFVKLLNALDTNYHSIEDFLEDNPGALAAIRNWIGEQNVSHWEKAIIDELEVADSDPDDEE